MFAWCLAGLLVLGTEVGEEKFITSKYPVPSEDALAKAEKLLEETYGKQIQTARTPVAQARLAQELLRLAKEDTIPAQKYVLAQKVKELAIAGSDSRLAVEAAEILADFAPSDTPISIQDALQKGDTLWKQAERFRGREQLASRVEAAAWYFRCIEDLTGFNHLKTYRSLTSLGWPGWPIHFQFNGNTTEGWTASVIYQAMLGNHVAALRLKEGCLLGRIVGGDPAIVRARMMVKGAECPIIKIRMKVPPSSFGQLFWLTTTQGTWSESHSIKFPVQHNQEFHVYRLDLHDHPCWKSRIIIGLRFDPGDWDHHKPYSGEFAIDFIIGGRLR